MNKVFITGKISNKIELAYYSNIPYTKNLQIECEGQTYYIQCCKENALNIFNNSDKNDILQVEGHLSKDKKNSDCIIIIADKVDIFRNDKTNKQLINELKEEPNINNCLNQNTKMFFSKMNSQHFIAMFNEISKISSMFNSIIYDETDEESNTNDKENKIDDEQSNININNKESDNSNKENSIDDNHNNINIDNKQSNINIKEKSNDILELKQKEDFNYRADAEKL